jgi:hypothetical protein
VIDALRMGFEVFHKSHRFVARQASNPIGDGRELTFGDGGVRRDPAVDLPIRGVIDGTRRVGLSDGFVVKADVLPRERDMSAAASAAVNASPPVRSYVFPS